ncbi:MAG: glycosyltransferase [Planctomycetes bacterium]|nr:glycosyltransferase [Planctomycetota bacterium]
MNKQLALDYFKKAEDCKINGRIEDAVSYYKKSLEHDDGFISAYYNLAILYHKLGLFSESIDTFKKIVKLNPADTSVYNNIGALYFRNNNLIEAKKYIELALSIEPNYEEAKKNLENIQKRLDETSMISAEKKSGSISFRKQNIGFVTVWYERGQAYVTKAIRDALSDQHNTFVFARNGGTLHNPLIETTGEWHVPNLVTYTHYKIPKEILVEWVKSHCITTVFFNEEYNFELIGEIKGLGVKTIGYYIWEWFNPDYVKLCNLVYDKIICPTKSCYQKFKSLGVNNIEYIQWGIDLNQFKPGEKKENTRVRFFHPAGWGGLHARRGTQFVIDAFVKMNNSESELLVHTQFRQDTTTIDNYHQHLLNERNIKIQYGTVSREEIIRMYQEADVAVLPSKWEGLGLTFLESIACGLPIITVDAPPMNEFVIHRETGYLCRVGEKQNYKGIFVDGVHVDIDDMAKKMQQIMDVPTRCAMKENTIKLANEFSFVQFKEKVQDIFQEVINSSCVNVRLNIGCGTDIKNGYINIDCREISGVNVRADVSHIPFKNMSVAEIVANDILEHFPRNKTQEVLKNWINLLRPEGMLKIQCPDIRTLAYAFVTNQIPANEFSRRIYGGQDYADNFHHAGFDVPEMKRILNELGMWPKKVSVSNGNFTIVASRKTAMIRKKLRILLIGSRLTNYPWGTENFIYKALHELGHDVIDFDIKKDTDGIGKFIEMDKDIVITFKGSGVNPRFIELMSCPTILWYPDDIQSLQHAVADIRLSGYAYDILYYINLSGLSTLKEMGISRCNVLLPATDPSVYKYYPGTKKKYDIVFVGNIYPDRRKLLDRLKKRFGVYETKAYMEDMARIFNEAKIVLNLGVTNIGYNLRVFEALGCRSFLLTNEINQSERFFNDREHLVYFNDQNIEDLAEYYLKHEEEREIIAENGYREVCAKHTFKHRVTQILADAGLANNDV